MKKNKDETRLAENLVVTVLGWTGIRLRFDARVTRSQPAKLLPHKHKSPRELIQGYRHAYFAAKELR
jgi:hypothetical protein